MHASECVFVFTAACGHGLVLSATNYYKVGERFHFADHQLVDIFGPNGVKVAFMDVGCMFSIWQNRVHSIIAKSLDPKITTSPAYAKTLSAYSQKQASKSYITRVSEWHGSTHSINCQVHLYYASTIARACRLLF